MQIQLYLRMLRNSWWVVALTALTALILTLLLALTATPQYEAQSRFLVGPAASFNPNQTIYSQDSLNRRNTIQTFSEVLNTSYMFAETATSLRMTPEEMGEYEHSTVTTPEANVLILTVAGPDPRRAAELANTLGRRAVDFLQGRYPAYEIIVISPAVAATTPVSPQPMRDVSIAVFLGLALGVILAIGREYLYIPAELLRKHTSIDSVSQAFNRRAFEHHLEQELIRNQTGPLSLGILRLDGLYDYIDEMPQPTTQKILRDVTQTLRNELRGKDIIGRWSETSYAVLLPGTPGVAATRTLERIQEMLAAPIELSNNSDDTLSLNPYVGVVACQSDKSARMLLERAEQAAERARDTDVQTVFVSADLKAVSG
jgi:diguanylate cyclase (GGDEF)-like protein